MAAVGMRKERRRPFAIFLVWMGLLLAACSESPPPPVDDRIGPGEVYGFEPDPQDYLSAPYPLPLAPTLAPEKALAELGAHLSRTYFRRDPEDEAAIRFEVLGLYRVPAPHRVYRLAVIDMIDPEGQAMQVFFQGSAGGQTTFYMLAAAFLQPQRDPPLADGLILLYNGKEFPETDHVDFRGIVTAEAVRPVVLKSLYRHRRGAPSVS